MVLRDGSFIDDIYYDGGDSVAVKVLCGRDDTEWRVTSSSGPALRSPGSDLAILIDPSAWV